MGLLDQLLGSVTAGNASAPAAAPVATPAPETALQSVVDLLHSPQVGGVAGLMRMFESHGLGNLAAGWVGQGANPGVSSGQLAQVLGPDRLAQFAQQLGLPQGLATQHLAQLLPHVVDHMTPDGTVPPTPTTPSAGSAVFDMLKSKLLG